MTDSTQDQRTAEIGSLVAVLRRVWLTVPEQRLGQLVSNAAHLAGAGSDPFFVTDDAIRGGLSALVPPRVQDTFWDDLAATGPATQDELDVADAGFLVADVEGLTETATDRQPRAEGGEAIERLVADLPSVWTTHREVNADGSVTDVRRAEINNAVDAFRRAWLVLPEQRLGQFTANAAAAGSGLTDPFQTSETALLAGAEQLGRI